MISLRLFLKISFMSVSGEELHSPRGCSFVVSDSVNEWLSGGKRQWLHNFYTFFKKVNSFS